MSRDEGLFTRLEDAFQHFLDQLPPGLVDLACQMGTYCGDSNPRRLAGLADLNPVLVKTPWLFWDLFKDLEDERFLGIAEAGAFFVLASIVLDHLVDGQTETPGQLALYHQALYSRGTALYRWAFPAPGDFWSHFDRLAAEHLAGLAAESALQAGSAGYTYQNLTHTASGKVAPIVATLAGFCAASGQMAAFPSIEASLKHISVASQLLDDIGDWQEDAQKGHLTYYLTLMAPVEVWQQVEPPAAEQLQQAIDARWVDVHQLKVVMLELNRAVEAVQELQCPAWVSYVDGYRAITGQHLERFVRRHLQRILIKISPSQPAAST